VRRETPLRRRLMVLAVAGTLPLAVMAAIGLFALKRQQDAQTRQVGVELARSIANAVDAEQRSMVSVLETLATTPSLDSDDYTAFLIRARRVVSARPDWAQIRLADPAGRTVADTKATSGAALPSLIEKESFTSILRTRTPAVGSLARRDDGEWLFAVRVPVFRDNAVRYVLTGLVSPRAIYQVLNRQPVPPDWLISIVDANGLRVARSRAHEENVGGRLAESVQRVVDHGGAEGFGIATSLEGDEIYTPYSRLPLSGWNAVLGLPTAVGRTAAYRSLALAAGGFLLSIGLGTLGALWVARGINRPIRQLGEAAEALGRGGAPLPGDTSIQEIRAVSEALSAAARAITKGEAERDDLLRKERHAREVAEAADRAKDEFLAILSHELRTPLNAVYGWARLLQSGRLDDQALVTRARDAIVRNAEAQVQLIDDLLDLSRITSGKMRLDARRIDLAPVVHEALDAVRPAAEAKAIRLLADVAARSGPVTADPGRVQQVVWNLLMNAVKFTPAGGEVRVSLHRAGSHVEIVVSDSGQGIAPELLPHVFERFRQADSSSTRAYGGLGLGLALVRHLVELHGGTVGARSAGQDTGATFIVTLPVVAAAAAGEMVLPAPRVLDDALARSNSPLDGWRVLVVDDERDALALAQATLETAGANVRACLSVGAALTELKQWRPDVLVSDIEMPGEDGYSLIRKVRALAPSEGGDTPAVALTAYGRVQDRLRALDAGFTVHLTKPVDPSELASVVASVAAQPRAIRIRQEP
jgi:signal transduction histidine kinase/CheY-like chemotaxis protein